MGAGLGGRSWVPLGRPVQGAGPLGSPSAAQNSRTRGQGWVRRAWSLSEQGRAGGSQGREAGPQGLRQAWWLPGPFVMRGRPSSEFHGLVWGRGRRAVPGSPGSLLRGRAPPPQPPALAPDPPSKGAAETAGKEGQPLLPRCPPGRAAGWRWDCQGSLSGLLSCRPPGRFWGPRPVRDGCEQSCRGGAQAETPPFG